jgi:hypothetical protein
MSGTQIWRGSAHSGRRTESAAASRVAIYLRVSTGRQAEQELSIPDQKKQAQAWIAQRGWSIVAEYIEPGASATDDKRPEFQRMIERASTVSTRWMSLSYTRSHASSAMPLASNSTCASLPSTACGWCRLRRSSGTTWLR